MNDGATTMPTAKHDWSALDAMIDEQVAAAVQRDPDAAGSSDEAYALARKTPRARIVRRALGLTQEAFATRFQIPIGTLRDWEQGRVEPDQTARAYLRAIAGDANAVVRALGAGPRAD